MIKLKEIKESFQIDIGAPEPKVLSNEFHVYLLFFEQSFDDDSIEKPVTVKFSHYNDFRFGGPNDEAIQGHPYYDYGLTAYAIYEVENSDWTNKVKNMNRVHPYHKDELFDDFKHYIFFFHDSCFEIICKNYELVYHSSETMSEEIMRVSKLL